MQYVPYICIPLHKATNKTFRLKFFYLCIWCKKKVFRSPIEHAVQLPVNVAWLWASQKLIKQEPSLNKKFKLIYQAHFKLKNKLKWKQPALYLKIFSQNFSVCVCVSYQDPTFLPIFYSSNYQSTIWRDLSRHIYIISCKLRPK